MSWSAEVGKFCQRGASIQSLKPYAGPAPTYNLNRCTIPFKSLANLAN